MNSLPENPAKLEKIKNNPGFQGWNKNDIPAAEGVDSTIKQNIQLKSKDFPHQPSNKLIANQKMAKGFDDQKKRIIQLQKNNTGLPDKLKSGVEHLSGLSMDDVKVHYNSDKPAQLNAHAYAQGTDIHIAAGQERHLPHEAWHVVQQIQGRVQPTMMMKGIVPVNDDQGLEKEADRMGAGALQLKPFSILDFKDEKTIQKKGVIQKAPDEQKVDFQEH